MRRVFVWTHRYDGLAMALFLVVEGLTGSLLAFRGDLSALFNPSLCKSFGRTLSLTVCWGLATATGNSTRILSSTKQISAEVFVGLESGTARRSLTEILGSEPLWRAERGAVAGVVGIWLA